MSTVTISETERTMLKYLGQSLKKSDCKGVNFGLGAEECERIYSLADRHEVSVLLGDVLSVNSLSPKIQNDFQYKTARTVHKGITLQSLDSRITALLEEHGITAVTLKGYAVARFYPVPEFRKTTDIDLFFYSEEDARKAGKILCKNGFEFSKKWHANHHLIMISEKKETVELHSSWADEFMDRRLNKYLKDRQKESIDHCLPIDCGGVMLYVYDTVYQAFYLTVHMLQHFTGGGFGLRNLCDWVVLWENCENEKVRNDFFKIACDSGTAKFAKAVTSVCTEYLGLSREKSPFPYDTLSEEDFTDELLRDILDAGEFGCSEPERMVGMDGNSFTAYIKEFHHQMHINFPKSGRVVLLWPFLWSATLIRFLYNNRKLNRSPISAIMKKAGIRGKLVKRLIYDK